MPHTSKPANLGVVAQDEGPALQVAGGAEAGHGGVGYRRAAALDDEEGKTGADLFKSNES